MSAADLVEELEDALWFRATLAAGHFTRDGACCLAADGYVFVWHDDALAAFGLMTQVVLWKDGSYRYVHVEPTTWDAEIRVASAELTITGKKHDLTQAELSEVARFLLGLDNL